MTDQEKEKVDRNAVEIARWSAISAVGVAAIALVGTVATGILGKLDKLPGGTIPLTPPTGSTSVPTPSPSPSPSLSPYPSPDHFTSLKIMIDLKQGQRVDRKQIVTGTVEGVMSSDRALYLYVYVPTLQDFPFYYFPVKISREIWNAHPIFGAVEDQGRSFQTGLVLANPQDPKWLNRNPDNGISELIGEPVGTKITVQRR